MDKLNTEVCLILFGEGSDRLVKSHSYRKGGASSYCAARIDSFDVKLIGRWSVGTLDFYLTVAPGTFVKLNHTMSLWALMAFETDLYVPPVQQPLNSVPIAFKIRVFVKK